MKYDIGTGVQRQQFRFKKLIIAGVASLGLAGAFGASALAASNDYCGSSANGCASAGAAGAQCDSGAGSGAFGAFGKDNNWAGGANGYNTGISNSSLCGNRQGNL